MNPNISICKHENDTKSANWIYTLRIPNSNYNDTQTFLHDKGIEIRPFFYPLHMHTHLSSFSPDENAIQLHKESFMIPSSPYLTINEIHYVIDCINELSLTYQNSYSI